MRSLSLRSDFDQKLGRVDELLTYSLRCFEDMELLAVNQIYFHLYLSQHQRKFALYFHFAPLKEISVLDSEASSKYVFLWYNGQPLRYMSILYVFTLGEGLRISCNDAMLHRLKRLSYLCWFSFRRLGTDQCLYGDYP